MTVTEEFRGFDGNGDAREREDARDKIWRTAYDEVGNTTRVGDPRQTATLDTTGAPEQTLAGSASPAGDGTTETAARESARNAGQAYVARFTYDPLDRQVAQVVPKRSSGNGVDDDRFRVTATTYDENDNVRFERDEEEHVTSREYTKTDELNSEQQPTAPTHAENNDPNTDGWSLGTDRAPKTLYAYDADDNLIRRKDPVPTADQPIQTGGYATDWKLDRLGRAVAQVREGADGAAGNRKTISRAYDHRDNVVGEVDAKTNGDAAADVAAGNALDTEKRRYTYIYDAFDRKRQQIENPRANPAPGATDVNRTTTWIYDKEDREQEHRTPGGRVTKRHYDDRGQLIELEEPFGYDAGDQDTGSWAKTTINRRRDGQIAEIVSPRGNASDDDDETADGPGTFTTRFRYHATGEVYRRWIPKAKDQYGAEWEVRYGINEVGDPTDIRDARHNLFSNTFLDTGELAGTARPGWWFYDEQNNQIRERTSQDPAPNDATTSKDGLPSEPGNGDFGKVDPQNLPDVLPLAGQTNIDYNNRLQPTAVKGLSDAGTADAIKQDLAYDALGRLTKRTIEKTAETDLELEWQYDVRGNVRARRNARDSTEGGSAVTTWRYDAFDRLTSTTEPPSCQGSGCLAPVTGQTWDRNDNALTMTLPTQANTASGTTTGTKTMTRDAADRTTVVVDEAGATTKEQFDVDDMVVKRYAPRAFTGGGTVGNPNEDYATEMRYDGAGRQTWSRSTVADDADGDELITETTYDREGNPREIKAPGARTESGTGTIPQRTTTRLYDARNLLWKETVASGTDEAATTVTEFDGQRNLRRTVNPKGVTGHGPSATVADDEGDFGLDGDTAKNATVLTYDENQLPETRVLPWDSGDGTHRYRQDFERTPRGLVSRITDVYRTDKAADASRYSTKIDRDLAGWPIKSTEQRATGTGPSGTTWADAPDTDPLKYDYDQLGNQTLWSSDGESRTIQRSFYRSGQLRVKCGRRTTGGDQEQVYSYRYDHAGGLKQVIDWMHHDAPNDDEEACQPAEQDDKPEGSLGVRATHIDRDRAGRPLSVQERWDGGKETLLRYVEKTPNLIESAQTNRSRSNNAGPFSGGTSMLYEYDEQDRNTAVKVNDGDTVPTTSVFDRETTMKWWPSGQRRQTLKPITTGTNRTRENRFYDARGQLVTRAVDPASTSVGETEHVYTYDKHGNRLRDERSAAPSTGNENPVTYNARNQLTKWTRKRTGALSERNPDKTTEWTDIDGAGRPIELKETIKVPQGSAEVETVIETTNRYAGDRLIESERSTVASGDGVTTTKSEQLDCFDYNVFGSQTQTHRQTNTGSSPAVPAGCKNGSGAWLGELETRNVFDTFERHTAGKQREHDEPGGQDVGDMNGTQAFCYDPFDRRDRRVTGLTGAADPAGTGDENDGRTRAQTACVTAASELGSGANAFDYSYLGLTEQLTRETRAGREQTYEYTAAGERLGRLKTTGTSHEWRSYDVDAQGSVVGLESETGGTVADNERYDTDPYGAPVAKDSTLSPEAQENPFRFQGFYRDQDTGTYDMQARTYRPETGRFLQQDRFENPQADLTLASDPLTNSRYSFLAGNPSSRAEYNGHECSESGLDTSCNDYAEDFQDKFGIGKGSKSGNENLSDVGSNDISYETRQTTAGTNQQVAGPVALAPRPRPAAQSALGSLVNTLESAVGSVGDGATELSRAIAKPVTTGFTAGACKLQGTVKSLASVGSRGGSRSDVGGCINRNASAVNEALAPDLTDPSAVAESAVGALFPWTRTGRLRKVDDIADGRSGGGAGAPSPLRGEFSVRDWSRYPGGRVPRPTGPFRMVEGEEYKQALRAKNNANRALHRAHPEWDGLEIHEIHPVKFGGSPTDPANKIVLSKDEHSPYTSFWRRYQANAQKR